MVYSKLVFLLLSTLFALTVGTAWKGGGQSNSFRKQDDHGNYAFGYQIKDPYGASNSREESGDAHGGKTGSYSLQDSDGRSRTVKYWADKSGFRAKIMSNEPSVISHEAADASYSGSDGGKGYGGGSYSYGGGQGGKW